METPMQSSPAGKKVLSTHGVIISLLVLLVGGEALLAVHVWSTSLDTQIRVTDSVQAIRADGDKKAVVAEAEKEAITEAPCVTPFSYRIVKSNRQGELSFDVPCGWAVSQRGEGVLISSEELGVSISYPAGDIGQHSMEKMNESAVVAPVGTITRVQYAAEGASTMDDVGLPSMPEGYGSMRISYDKERDAAVTALLESVTYSGDASIRK